MEMSKPNFFRVFVLILIFGYNTSAQEIWTLEKCIQRAIDKSLQVQGSDLSLRGSEIDVRQAQHSRYPNLSASTNVGWNFGRTIDPTRNEFVTETFFNNGFSLNSNVLIYNGGRVTNSINQAYMGNKAAMKDLEQTKRDISLNVASLYLNILFAKENLQNAENQLRQTNDQLTLLNKQIVVGNRPENDRLDLDAQIAVNEQNITEARNNLNINLLNLKQLLRIEPDKSIDIVAPLGLLIDTDPDIVTFEEVFAGAISSQPSLQANELRIKSAQLGQKIAAADLLPSLGAGGSLRTNYSNKGFTPRFTGITYNESTVLINNQEVTVGFPDPQFELEKIPYFDQFKDNLSYGVGVSLSIPIYNNYTAQSGVQRAKLNVERAQFNYDQIKESLKITVGQALADAKAAKARFLATERTKNAQSNVYNNALKRFEAGSTNVFELTRLKTQMETADINHLIAKYDYLFRSKVLDFYLGKTIKLGN